MRDSVFIGDKLDLILVNESLSEDLKKQKMYSSKVLDFKDDKTLQISMPIYEGKIVPLTVGGKYEATFYSKKGLLQCRVLIIERYKEGAIFLSDIVQLSPLKKVQRREYYRMDCRMEAEYRAIPENENKMDEEELELIEWTKGIVIDLSGGGLRMLTKERGNKGDLLQIRFRFQGNTEYIKFILYANSVRISAYENNDKIYDNRLEFYNIEDAEREKLIKCIFEEERRKLAQIKG